MTTPQTPPTDPSTVPTAPPVHEAWARVMAEVRAVGKTDRVKTGPAQFNFRGIDGVLNAVGPIFRKYGVYVAPIGVDILSTEHNPTKSGGKMKDVTISVTWRVTGPAGDTWTGVSLGEGSDSGDKAVSKAHSVAFRTFLIQSLALPTDEPDPDHTIYERAAEPDYWRTILDSFVIINWNEDKLRELWFEKDFPNAPAWASKEFNDHVQAVREAVNNTAETPAASGDAQ